MFDGWHSTGMVGVLGAAAACARLMKVPATAIPHVMGIAASLASGFTANFATMTKPLHCGNAARNGVLAATLGKARLHRQSGGVRRPQRLLPDVRARHRRVARRLQGFRQPLRSREPAATASSRIRAAASPTPRSRPRSNCASASAGGSTTSRASTAASSRAAGQRAVDHLSGRTPSRRSSASAIWCRMRWCTARRGSPRSPTRRSPTIASRRSSRRSPPRVDPELGRGDDDSPAKIRITMTDGQVFEAAQGFLDRLEQAADVAGAARGEVLRLRGAGDGQGQGGEDPRDPERSCRAARSFDDFWPLFRKA